VSIQPDELPELDEATRLTSETLLRNVHPSYVEKGFDEPSPMIFSPTQTDLGLLSVDRESRRTAVESFLFRRDVMQRKTAGVLAVTTEHVAEVLLEAHENEVDGNDAHAVIDFRPRLAEREVIRETLLKRALEQGWQVRA